MSNIAITRAQRLDQYVTDQFAPHMSRAHAARIIVDGLVAVNGSVVDKPGYKLRTNDAITIDYEPPKLEQLPKIELEIMYEDDDCIIVNKPVGILTHSNGVFNAEATVASWLRQYLGANPSETGPTNRAGIVHRLDRATSGVMVVAKHQRALSWLQKQFSQRRVKKTYVAMVAGHLDPPAAVVDLPIERNPKAPATFRIGPNGKSALTSYTVAHSSRNYDYVVLKPTTGRTHQLRVHMHYLGHAIIGDIIYDGLLADRMYLHAASLELTLPNRERRVFEAPVPADFEALLKADA